MLHAMACIDGQVAVSSCLSTILEHPMTVLVLRGALARCSYHGDVAYFCGYWIRYSDVSQKPWYSCGSGSGLSVVVGLPRLLPHLLDLGG